MINELLAQFRAEWLEIDVEKPWEHPDIKEFYADQWADISGLLRRFDGRIILDVIQQNKWICNPKYQMKHPLRSKKLLEQLKDKNIVQPQNDTKQTLTNFVKEKPKKERAF